MTKTLISNSLWQINILKLPWARRWVVMLSMVKSPAITWSPDDTKFKTISQAREYVDKHWPSCEWITGRKAYIKAEDRTGEF